MHLLAAVVVHKTIWHTLRRLGGPGLIVLGLVDNSAIPLPGSMDALTIVLAAAHKEPWWYYAIMATIGSLIGGYLTYRLGAKGGKETLEKKVSKKRAVKDLSASLNVTDSGRSSSVRLLLLRFPSFPF